MRRVFALLFVLCAFIVNAQTQVDPTPEQLRDTGRNTTSSSNQVVMNPQIAGLQKDANIINYKLGKEAIDISPKSGENTEIYTRRLQDEINYQKQIIEETKKAYEQGKADAQQAKPQKQRGNNGGIIAAGVAGLIIGAGVMNGNNRYRSYGNRGYYGGGYGYDYNRGYYGQNTYYSPMYGPQRVYNPRW